MTDSLDDVIATCYEERERKLKRYENNGLLLVKAYLGSLKISNSCSLSGFVIDG